MEFDMNAVRKLAKMQADDSSFAKGMPDNHVMILDDDMPKIQTLIDAGELQTVRSFGFITGHKVTEYVFDEDEE